jgi:hypothetical protein
MQNKALKTHRERERERERERLSQKLLQMVIIMTLVIFHIKHMLVESMLNPKSY